MVGRPSFAANPSAEQALKLTPIQEGVDYDRPTPEEAAKCKISARKIDGHVGWVVESPDGLILRKFVDTNGDNVVDQWSYYKDGVEVYRDIDSDFNGKADQYRWFNTGGTRWGVTRTKTGNDRASWKVISAEEVTAEVVAALAKQDVQRFTRLLLTPDELQSLGLGQGEDRRPGGEDRQGRGRFQGPARPGRRPSRRRPSGCSSAAPSRRRAGRHRRSGRGPARL